MEFNFKNYCFGHKFSKKNKIIHNQPFNFVIISYNDNSVENLE